MTSTTEEQAIPAAEATAATATPAKGKPPKTATVRAHAARVAPRKATSRKKATPARKRAAAGKPAIKLSAAAKTPVKKPARTKKPGAASDTKSMPRPDSKSAKVLAMIGKKSGATIADLKKATGWQPHTLRAFISVATRKRGLKIASTKNAAGERTYRIGR